MGSAMTDLTTGSPRKQILMFSIPILMTTLLQQFYGIVDTIIVGKFLGKQALAGVGATGAIQFMILGFCIGLCMGFTVPVAQRFGAKDYSGLRKYVGNAVWTGLIFAAVLTTIVCILCRDILIWMRTPADILDDAYTYLFIIFAGIPISIAYNLLAGIIRSLGDSKSPFIFLLMASVVNVGFDILSVTVLHMGIKGPAIATLSSQLFSVVLCLIHICRKFSILKMHREDWVFRGKYVKWLCNMGLPMGLQYSITAIGNVILQAGINSLGSNAVAAMTAGGRLNGFFACVTDALGSGMATFAGQNLGAKKYQRIRDGLWEANKIGIVYSIIVFVLMCFTSKKLVLLFLDSTDVGVIADASKLMIINSAFYILLTFVNVFRFTIQGSGYSGFAMLAGVLEMIARTIVGVVLIPVWGYTASCFASPAAWLLADAFLIPAFYYVLRKLRARGDEVTET